MTLARVLIAIKTQHRTVLPLYTFLKVLYFFLRKTTFYILFSGVNTFLYFFLQKMVNLVIEDSSDFTFYSQNYPEKPRISW